MICTLVSLRGQTKTKPIAILLQDVALCLAGLVACFGFVLFPYNRQRTSALLKAVNEMNGEILRRHQNAISNLRFSNRLHQLFPIVCLILQVTGLLVCPKFCIEFVKTGVPYFTDGVLYEPFSVWAYISQFLQVLTIARSCSLVTFYMLMYIEVLLRISFHFRVTAEEMRQLRNSLSLFDEEEELSRLKKLVQDANFLYWWGE